MAEVVKIELHAMLDDGWPHCSCGESFRGKHYWEWEKHAFEALRTEVEATENLRMDYRGAERQVRQLLERNERLEHLRRAVEAWAHNITSPVNLWADEPDVRMLDALFGEGTWSHTNDNPFRDMRTIFDEPDTVADLVEEITEGSLVMGTCERHVDRMMDDEPLLHPRTATCEDWEAQVLAPSACARCSSPTPNPACPDCCPENDKHTAAQVSILDLLPILGTCDSSHNMRHDGVQALHGQVPGCRRWKEGVPPIPTPVLGTCESVPEGGPEVLHNFICWNPHIEGPRCVGFQPLPTATTPESPASGVAEWIGEMPAKSVDTEALMPLPHPIDYLGVCEHEGHAHKGRHMLRFSCENWHATAEPDPKAFLNYDPKKGEVAPLGKCLTGHYVSPDGVQARHYAEVTCLQWRLAEPEALLGTCELFGRPHVERNDCKGWNTKAALGFCDRHHEADGTHEEYLHAWSSVCDGWHLPFMGTLE